MIERFAKQTRKLRMFDENIDTKVVCIYKQYHKTHHSTRLAVQASATLLTPTFNPDRWIV